jgi:hypothetical protein
MNVDIGTVSFSVNICCQLSVLVLCSAFLINAESTSRPRRGYPWLLVLYYDHNNIIYIVTHAMIGRRGYRIYKWLSGKRRTRTLGSFLTSCWAPQLGGWLVIRFTQLFGYGFGTSWLCRVRDAVWHSRPPPPLHCWSYCKCEEGTSALLNLVSLVEGNRYKK